MEEHEKHHEHEEKEEHEHAHEKEQNKEPEKKQSHEQPSEKKDLRDSRLFVIVFTLAGAAMALLSSILKSGGISSWITGAIGIMLLIILSAITGRLFRRKLKFYAANIFMYLLIWLVVWIFLFNL